MAFLEGIEKSQYGEKIKQRLMKGVSQIVKKTGLGLLDLALPPRCLSCGERVQQAGHLCAGCWKGLNFLGGAQCYCCGFPFEYDREMFLAGETLCMACLSRPRQFDRARAALHYDDGSRKMIISFKHGDHTEYADYFALLLAQAAKSLSGEAHMMTVVPLHKKRLFARRYNQAALMAHPLAQKLGLAFVPDLLVRHKHTPPQQGNMARRTRNIRGAFSINPHYKEHIKHKNILVVDDVFTTGATADACAKALKKQGAAGVELLSVARVCAPATHG